MSSRKSVQTGMPPPLHKTRKDKRDQRRTSCCGCRQRKAKCSRTWPCVSCTMRKEECVWNGGIPIADSSTDLADAQAEIAALRALVASLMERGHGRDGAPESPPEEELPSMDPPKLFKGSSYGTQFGCPPDCSCQNPSATHHPSAGGSSAGGPSATQPSYYQAPPPPSNLFTTGPPPNAPWYPYNPFPSAYYVPPVSAYPQYTPATPHLRAPPAGGARGPHMGSLHFSNPTSSSQAAYPYPYGLPSPSASTSFGGGPPGSPTSARVSWDGGRGDYSEVGRGDYGEADGLSEIGEDGKSSREGEEEG